MIFYIVVQPKFHTNDIDPLLSNKGQLRIKTTFVLAMSVVHSRHNEVITDI